MVAEPRAGYAKGRTTKETIVQAAIALFGEVGYNSASLREIAARAGISHPGLLHHFPSKTALVEEVLNRRDAEDASIISSELDSGTDFFDILIHLTRRNAERRSIVEAFTVLAAEATSPDHPAHPYFQRRYSQTLALIEEHCRTWQRAGRLRDGVDPAVAARSVVALMDGLQVQWLYSNAADVDMATHLCAYRDLILR